MARKKKKFSLFLDSGAHSAFMSGAEIDIDEYIKFIHENKKNIEVYVNLDVIHDPVATWENQKYMESCGLKPLPVFHAKEDFKWLKKYMDNYEYLGIGGAAIMANTTRIKYLDTCWDILTDDKGRPHVKAHGFAVTFLDAMLRYPWASVDSVSWVKQAAFGSIFVPRFDISEGVFNFKDKPISLYAGNNKSNRLHINHLSKTMMKHVNTYLESLQLKLKDISGEGGDVCYNRQFVCLMYYEGLRKQINADIGNYVFNKKKSIRKIF